MSNATSFRFPHVRTRQYTVNEKHKRSFDVTVLLPEFGTEIKLVTS